MRQPLVSIITPTHNIEEYVGRCIESVLAQDYKNWEMIIIDDASVDKTYEVCKSYAKRDKRIRLFKHGENWGVPRLSETYNQALAVSSGEFIAILEGDDYWPKDKLAKQIREFSDKNIILSYADAITVSAKGQPLKVEYYKNKPKSWILNDPPGSILYAFADLNFSFQPLTVMIRKEALLKIGGFKKHNIFPFVDYPTWFRLALEGKFSYFGQIAGYYRKHTGSEWFKFSLGTKARGRKEVQIYFLDFLKEQRSRLRSLNINIDIKRVIEEQRKQLEVKEKRGNLSILLHYVSFEDRAKTTKMIKKILAKPREGLDVKLVALSILTILPIQRYLMWSQFIVRFFFYKLNKLPTRILNVNAL